MAPGCMATNVDQLIAFTEPMAPRCCRQVSREQTMNDGYESCSRSILVREIERASNLAFWKLALSATGIWAFNIRTNHVHTVVSADCKPERILSALKANATRSMREAGCWRSDRSPWVYRGSKRYLWTEKELLDAVAYVTYGQGEPLQNPER